MTSLLEIKDLTAFYGPLRAIKDVSLSIQEGSVTALIGPSGCGKSTLLRTLNRMHELSPGAKVKGQVLLDGRDLYQLDPVYVRQEVGMIFQRPNPFPTMSIRENVLAGIKLNRKRIHRIQQNELMERCLRSVNLWDEVHNRLGRPGGELSGGQQQRLCIARAITVSPRVILMDEPCSALDPVSTKAIEQLICKLKEKHTIVIVTHNMQQASRVSDWTAVFNVARSGGSGELVEHDKTEVIFTSPKNEVTLNYISGKFG
ncbi:phosphate ABC transporter ATP-binding protein [Tropheryma whipplei]|uniref:phosphate ABC transporter ATP-binding protein n=1 Tax=Tropheryma whipplei TaxID=2039 RepID=UPI0004B5A4B3|nr:phosphate ABC transporter ATP-binding protein [Tropheryma whipplei]